MLLSFCDVLFLMLLCSGDILFSTFLYLCDVFSVMLFHWCDVYIRFLTFLSWVNYTFFQNIFAIYCYIV